MKRMIFLTILALGIMQTGKSQVISEWRGIGRTGVYNEPGLLRKWPDQGPQLLWAIKDLPKGHSSVAVGKDKLYLTGTKGEQEVLIALDMNGKKLWETPIGRAWTESFPESRCTPTIDGNRIYVTTGMLDAACVDAEKGTVIWAQKVNEKFEGTLGQWGKAESPVVLDDKVFFTPGGNKTTMVALNKMTGATVWTSESLGDKSSYVSPLLIDRNGMKMLVGVGEKFAYGISAQDGKILWKFDYGSFGKEPDNTNINCNTPLYKDNCIFFFDGYDHANVMLKLADDDHSVSLLWSDKTLDTHHGGAVLLNGYIYGSNWLNNSNGNWVCLDWKTGKVMYETKWFNKGQIIADDGMLYCYEEKSGNFGLVRATPEKFDLVSSFKVPFGSGPYWTHPVIHHGILYVRHGEALMAYDINEKK